MKTVDIPFNSAKFLEAWMKYKEFLRDAFDINLTEIEEKYRLEKLFNISMENEKMAIEYIDYYITNRYKHIFTPDRPKKYFLSYDLEELEKLKKVLNKYIKDRKKEVIKNNILSRYPTWDMFMKEQSPDRLCVNYDDVKEVDNVYSTSDITLKLLTELYTLDKYQAGYEYIQRWLIYLNDSLNINIGLQPGVIKHISYMIYAKYSYFRLSDMKLLFDYILESRYATFYGSIDTQRIMLSFYEYNLERKDSFIKKEGEENG